MKEPETAEEWAKLLAVGGGSIYTGHIERIQQQVRRKALEEAARFVEENVVAAQTSKGHYILPAATIFKCESRSVMANAIRSLMDKEIGE